MTDTERVLNLLIHDLRTPLGVAHGYLRLIREERLTTTEDRERAFASTQQALGRISRLCEEASAFLDNPEPKAAVRAGVSLLMERVTAQLGERAAGTVSMDSAGSQTMVVGAGVDRLADAVSTVLQAMTTGRGVADVRIELDGAELRFLTAAAAPAGFDPWRGHGLAVPLACRLIASVGGRVGGHGSGALAIVFPVEMAPE